MARSRALARRPAVHTGPLKETQRRFLKAYVESGTIRDGAIAAKVGRQTHYDWLQQHDAYRIAFQAAKDEAVEGLEAECRKRALARSDLLLMFLLKAHKPAMYRDRWEGKLDTTSVVAELTPAMLKHMSTDELATARTLFRKMLGAGNN